MYFNNSFVIDIIDISLKPNPGITGGFSQVFLYDLFDSIDTLFFGVILSFVPQL